MPFCAYFESAEQVMAKMVKRIIYTRLWGSWRRWTQLIGVHLALTLNKSLAELQAERAERERIQEQLEKSGAAAAAKHRILVGLLIAVLIMLFYLRSSR
jgi:hypothetical protein